MRGLAALVLLFDLYAIYQHLQLQRMRRQLAERDQLFQLISENAADMIALVDGDGRRLYNSPALRFRSSTHPRIIADSVTGL